MSRSTPKLAFTNVQAVLDWINSGQAAQTITTIEEISPELVMAYMASKGFSQIVTDGGQHFTWAKGRNLIQASGAGQTATTTGNVLTTVSTKGTVGTAEILSAEGKLISTTSYTQTSVGAAGLSTTASGTAVGDVAAGVALTPKTAILCGVAGALGLSLGFDAGQDLVDHLFFNDEAFDWKTDSIGGKIITFVTRDGKTYVSSDLVQRIKDTFEENGAFASGELTPVTNTYTDFTSVPTFSIFQLISIIGVSFAYRHTNATERTHLQTLLAEASTYVEDHGGVGSALIGMKDSYFNRTDWWISLTIEQANSTRIKGQVTGSATLYTEDGTVFYGTYLSTSGNQLENPGKVRTVVKYYPNRTTKWERSTTPSATATTISQLMDYSGLEEAASNVGTINDPMPKRQGATLPTEGHTIAQDYPTWDNNARYADKRGEIVQDDTQPREKYLPVTIPYTNPETPTQAQLQDGTATDEDTQAVTQTIEDAAQEVVTPQPEPTPWPDPLPLTQVQPVTPVVDPVIPDQIGQTPTIVLPTSGTGTGFIRVYNPTYHQLADFSQWLWSGLFDLSTLKKLFQDPMQAIIGLHLLYATPSLATDPENIIVGNLDSDCPSRVVSNQYVEIDCGTLTVNQYYRNALDYTNTKIDVFLPFIGITPLNVSEVMGRDVNVKYMVDVLTGTCLATIIVNGRQLYTYSGNASIQLPLSSANYSSCLSSLVSLAGGIGAAVVSGGSLAPLAITGAATAATHMQHGVERSGSIGSNAGAMGVKKPYLIIERHTPYNPSAYETQYGYPSNSNTKLSALRGYTKVKEVHIKGIEATSEEIAEIKSLLQEGVIL